MRFNRFFTCLMCIIAGYFPLPGVAGSYIDMAVNYTQGNFGTSQTSELTQFLLTYGQVEASYDYSITLPYLYLHDEFGDEHGVGDILLRAGKRLMGDSLSQDSLYLSVSLKLPTANDANGLGTGESDVGAFLSYEHSFDSTTMSVYGGYIITGDTDYQTYKDVLAYGLGLSHTFQVWSVYLSLNGQQQTLATGDDPLEMSAGFYYQLRPAFFIRAEVMQGLNDASPDSGFTIGVVNWF